MRTDEQPPQMDGTTLAHVTNGIVRLYAHGYGKGPVRARSHLIGDILMCVMFEGLLPAELTLLARGQGSAVYAMRRAWQDAMRQDFREIVEGATGRRVEAFLSQLSLEPAVHVEIFILEPLDVTDGGQRGAIGSSA